MKHLRDPVTGECTVCGPSHGKATPKPKPVSNGWSVVQTHTYYGAGGRPPSPSRKTASPSGVHFADQRGRSHSQNYYGRGRHDRSPSPEPGCCGGRSRGRDRDKGYGRDRNKQSTKHGQVDPSGKGGYGGSRGCCWGRRRCCAILLALLLLLLLAGLAVGLYFGITAQRAQQARAAQQANVLQNMQTDYIIYGADQPCNPYNNNTGTGNAIPNCDSITTVIALAPSNFTPPTTPIPLVAVTAAAPVLQITSLAVMTLIMCVLNIFLQNLKLI